VQVIQKGFDDSNANLHINSGDDLSASDINLVSFCSVTPKLKVMCWTIVPHLQVTTCVRPQRVLDMVTFVSLLSERGI